MPKSLRRKKKVKRMSKLWQNVKFGSSLFASKMSASTAEGVKLMNYLHLGR